MPSSKGITRLNLGKELLEEIFLAEYFIEGEELL